MKCCNKNFINAKAYSNHKRWCSGLVKYKSETGYYGIHAWVRRRKEKPKACEVCHIKPPRDLANISRSYKRDIDDYKYMCRGCHKKYDFNEHTRLIRINQAIHRCRDERGRFI